jgi:energy-converting hydrogenase Eha subunit F
MHRTCPWSPHVERRRELPGVRRPVLVPVLLAVHVAFVLLIAHTVPEQWRRELLQQRPWPIGAASVVAGQLAGYVYP